MSPSQNYCDKSCQKGSSFEDHLIMTMTPRLQVGHQLDAIRSACIAYDGGNLGQAQQIAEAAKALFHGTNGSDSLLFGDIESAVAGLISTTSFKISEDKKSNALGFIGMNPTIGGFQPMLETTGRRETISIKCWWGDEAILRLIGRPNAVITRRQIVLASVGVEGVIDRGDLAHLRNGFSLSVEGRLAGGHVHRVSLRFADLCILRQIGHELLASAQLDIFARAERPIPRRILIEPEMKLFVRNFGGKVVEDILGPAPNLKDNAYFVFEDNDVVAELKCMSDDTRRFQLSF
jgi:hypothetical protein